MEYPKPSEQQRPILGLDDPNRSVSRLLMINNSNGSDANSEWLADLALGRPRHAVG
jgi:hypothetical protein